MTEEWAVVQDTPIYGREFAGCWEEHLKQLEGETYFHYTAGSSIFDTDSPFEAVDAWIESAMRNS